MRISGSATKRTEIPVLGWYLKKTGGYPSTPFERVRGARHSHTRRWLVNSKTFEPARICVQQELKHEQLKPNSARAA